MLYPGQAGLLLPTPGLTVARPRGNSALYNSLISFWKLDEASGTRNDNLGSNHLTDNNTVTSTTGLTYNTAAQFAQANVEYLSRASNSGLQTGNVDFWAACWAKFTTANDVDGIIGKANTFGTLGNTNEWRIYAQSGIFGTFYNPSGIGVANAGVTPNTTDWYFIAIFHDAVNDLIGISVDGASYVTSSYSAGVNSTSTAFAIGLGELGNTPRCHNGLVGPAMFGKNYIPTQDDIAFLYNSGAGRTFEAMAAY